MIVLYFLSSVIFGTKKYWEKAPSVDSFFSLRASDDLGMYNTFISFKQKKKKNNFYILLAYFRFFSNITKNPYVIYSNNKLIYTFKKENKNILI